MRTERWRAADDGPGRLCELAELGRTPGPLVVTFEGAGCGGPLPWSGLEGWIASRAVTVAEVRCDLGSPGLEVALTSDLVVLREGARLGLPPVDAQPQPGLMWAACRAGRGALARVLLSGGDLDADEALRLGLVHAVLAPEEPLPVDTGVSVAALTGARDLIRAGRGGGSGVLELATFRLLFATGDPGEGARAFLERRPARFSDG